MHKSLLSLMLASSILAGCTMIPDYSRPLPPVAAEWPLGLAGEQERGATTPVGAIRWQAFFQSPELREVIATALEHNRDLRIAALRVEEARAAYQVQRADLFPKVSADIAGSRQKIDGNTPFGGGGAYINEYYTAQVGASWTVDVFGRIRSLSRSALEQYLATEEAQRAVQVSLIAEVANAYLQLQADREILRLTEETLEAQEKSFKLISERFQNGVGTQLELSQAQIPVETARANHALYTRLAMQDRNALMVLLGKENADTLLGETKLADVALMEDLPVALPSEVLLLRPDVRQAEHELLAANANIGAARAAFFPSISLTGSAGRASPELGDLFSGGAGTIWSFAPSISLPIFQGGANMANLEVSEVRKHIAVANYEKVIQNAFREVADELTARATLDDQYAAQSALVQATQKAYDVSNARFGQGIDSFLTVLDAQRSLYAAEQQLIEIQKQQLANRVNLYKVLGGGQLLAEADTQQQQQELQRQAEEAAAQAPRPTYRREMTVVHDTPEGAVTEYTAITTQETEDGKTENVAERSYRYREEETPAEESPAMVE